jgi:group I intron endonuclease
MFLLDKFVVDFIKLDAPTPWGLFFQDSAAPQMEGIEELHNNIMFYLAIILFTVTWILITVIRNFISSRSPISHKYMNHGRYVPIQKCSKFNNTLLTNKMSIRTYTTLPNNPTDSNISEINVAKTYEDAYTMRKYILKENKGKSGIYMLTNKLTKDIYIGQSIDLSKRFRKYFSPSYIKSKDSLIISRALIKYGYSNFYLTILEYCDKSDLLVREQYYFDKLNPQYNILKIAGSSKGFKVSEETKVKILKSLKGIYVKEKSVLFGRLHTEETKKLMNLKKAGDNNPLFGKIQSKDTKELIRQKALDRKHSEDTKLKMSAFRENPVNIYEKCSSEGFKLIGSFVSARRAAKFLEISGSTVIRYMNSGEIFKDRYKFSSK